MRLPRVNTSSYQHDLFSSNLLTIRRVRVFFLTFTCDSEQRQVESAQTLCELGGLDTVPVLSCDVRYEILQPCIGVRNRVGEVNALILLLKVVLELQLEGFPIEAVPADSFHPMNIITSLLLPFSVFHQLIGPKSVGVEILAFAEVAEIELHFSKQISVIDLEIVPTSMSSSVSIAPQKQVELALLHPHSYVQIS